MNLFSWIRDRLSQAFRLDEGRCEASFRLGLEMGLAFGELTNRERREFMAFLATQDLPESCTVEVDQ